MLDRDTDGLISTLIVHANHLAVSHLDVERDRLTANLTVLDELLVPRGQIDGYGRVLEAMGTAENELFLHRNVPQSGPLKPWDSGRSGRQSFALLCGGLYRSPAELEP